MLSVLFPQSVIIWYNLTLQVFKVSEFWHIVPHVLTSHSSVFRSDWYNLEKSKRVKAFRCGEFDACIERAEATQGTLAKKREKYARREDAILHALELERKLLASKHQHQGFRPTYFSGKPS
jgi:hypothetical protein